VDAYTLSGPLRVAASNAARACPARTQERATTVELESAVRMHSTVRLRSCRLYPRERTRRQTLHRACRSAVYIAGCDINPYPATRLQTSSARLCIRHSSPASPPFIALPTTMSCPLFARQRVALWSHQAGSFSQLRSSDRYAACPAARPARAWPRNRAQDRTTCNEDKSVLWEGQRLTT